MCVDTANCSGTCSECIQDKVRRLTMANTQLTKMCDQYLAELATERQRATVMHDALVSIHEYWNRNRNDQAMFDACWHAVDTAEAALAVVEQGEQT